MRQLTFKKTKTILGSLALLLLALQTHSFGTKPTEQTVQAKTNQKKAAPRVIHQLGEVSLEAPFQFGPTVNIMSSLPAELQKSLEYIEIVRSENAINPGVSISRLAYKPGVSIKLDDTMKASMEGAISGINAGLKTIRPDAEGESEPTKPEYESEGTTISGLAARRASYTQNVQGTTIRIEGVFLQEGQKFWTILIVATGENHESEIKRILDSLQIQPLTAEKETPKVP